MSRRLEFEERAAVLEFDGGLARAGAEQRALADIYHELLGCRGRAHGILDELIRVDARRQAPELHEALQALGLAGVRAPLWGFGYVVVAEQDTWRPAGDEEPGMAALIVPACEEGAIVDLVAQRLGDGHLLSRLGAVDLLGWDELQIARDRRSPLLVYRDVLTWLRGQGRGTVILDWARAHRHLDGLGTLLCSERSALLLHRATRRCRPAPTIGILRPREARHAA